MKTKFLSIAILVFASLCPASAQRDFLFGVRSNIGVFGFQSPASYELKDEALGKIDGFHKKPNLAFSVEILTDYTFVRVGDFSMAIQLGLGYNYTSFSKEWHFKGGYDLDFNHYLSEQQIIHDLEAVYLTLPLRGSMKFRKLKGSLGLSGNRILHASIDRSFKTREGSPLGEWTVQQNHYLSFKKEDESMTVDIPYLSRFYGYQILIGLEYQITKNIFIGLEARQFYASPSLYVLRDGRNDGPFYFREDMLSFSFLFLY